MPFFMCLFLSLSMSLTLSLSLYLSRASLFREKVISSGSRVACVIASFVNHPFSAIGRLVNTTDGGRRHTQGWSITLLVKQGPPCQLSYLLMVGSTSYFDKLSEMSMVNRDHASIVCIIDSIEIFINSCSELLEISFFIQKHRLIW